MLRISLSDEAEKRWRKRKREGESEKRERERGTGERRVTRVKVRVLVNYETLLSIGGNCALLRKVLRVRAKFSAGRAAILRGIKTSGGGARGRGEGEGRGGGAVQWAAE